ncbi:MAG TPA: GlpM family protein [Gammaproteobacteria bacterium]|nr:GlpM family protein [Gammaproteobacteria bacterium]
MSYLFKGLVGGFVVIAIALLARSRFSYLAGLAPLFPTFALFAHVFAYGDGGATSLKAVAYFGLLAILPYSAYLLTVIGSINHFGIKTSLALALVAWTLGALAITAVWDRYLHALVLGTGNT